jgi:multiple sugar transport system permease protein
MNARRSTSLRIARGIVMVLLIVGSLVFLLPFYTSFTMSLKSPTELATTAAWAWPKDPSLKNYGEVLSNPNVDFGRLFWNTVIIASTATLGAMLSASLVAYAFARIRFAGRERLFLLVLSTMMLPGIVTMIPTYVLCKYLHWVNTFLPLTVPAFLGGGAFNIFLLRQFFLGIPKELDEAAILDGASHWTIYTRIVMPLSGSALATVGIFAFIYNWRDFMGPLIYLNDVEKQTLEIGLATYNSLRAEQWQLLMAGSVLVTIPLIVLFISGLRYFVKGMAMTGFK